MSIVVGVQKDGLTVLASDSLSVFGSHREDQTNIINNQKILTVGAAYLGYTGWGLYGNILAHYLKKQKTQPKLTDETSIFSFFLKFLKDLRAHYNLVNDQASGDKDPFADLDSCFIVANRRGIFGVSSNLSVCQYRTFHAIGSGCDYAFGVLHALYDTKMSADQIARVAIEAAIRFDSDCGGEVVINKITGGRSNGAASAVRHAGRGPGKKTTAKPKVKRRQ